MDKLSNRRDIFFCDQCVWASSPLPSSARNPFTPSTAAQTLRGSNQSLWTEQFPRYSSSRRDFMTSWWTGQTYKKVLCCWLLESTCCKKLLLAQSTDLWAGRCWISWHIRGLARSAPTLVSQRWTNCCSVVWKLFWIDFGTQSKLRHTAFRIS